MNQGVEGSEQAPEQLTAFYFPSKVYRNTEKSYIWESGKWIYFVFYAPLVLSTMWTTHLAWCWTSWRRLASACWRWRGWDRRWCGASTRRRSDRSVDCTKIPGKKKSWQCMFLQNTDVLGFTFLSFFSQCSIFNFMYWKHADGLPRFGHRNHMARVRKTCFLALFFPASLKTVSSFVTTTLLENVPAVRIPSE